MDDSPIRGREEAGRRRRFETLYAQYRAPVLGYIVRRVDPLEEAGDLLAETFLVAWRRLDEVPDGERAIVWLYGVARRALANQRRGEKRRNRLADRLRAEISAAASVAQLPGTDTIEAAAFRSLSHSDRELLALSGWEGLDAGEIGVVLGCSRNAARIRLHRARRRLRAALAVAQADEDVLPHGESTRTSSEGRRTLNRVAGVQRSSGRRIDLIIDKGDIS